MTNRLRTVAEVDRLRARHDRPEFAGAWTALLTRADTALAQGLRPVGEAAGWGHGYYCPEHVVPLDFDPGAPDVHLCPVDGVRYEGPVFDGGWRCALNSRILDGIGAAASVWQATGDVCYRDHVVDILLDYADRYPGLPLYGHHVGKGRVTGQSLEEAVWGIGIARAFDGVRDSLDPGDAKAIETNLLGEIGRHVTDQLMGKIHNIECWHLAALATIGVVLDDADLLALALDGEFSLPAQLREGILDDGWWAEGSPSYHFYMLASVLNAAIALREQVPEFLATPGLRDMFTTPLAMMRSDFSLPAFNDGWNSISMPLGMAQYAPLYEQGFGLWHGQAEEDYLRSVYARGIERTSEAALTMGPDLARPAPAQEWVRRTVHPASGYAVLADGAGSGERYLLLKYGPHGGGHGHPDKLELDLHAFGVRLAPDAGSPAYISPLQGPWVRQTLSHNTVVLDEESQPPAQGRLRAYLDPASNPVGVVDTEVSWPVDPDEPNGRPGSWLKEPRVSFLPAYAGASMRRIVVWKAAPAGYFLDLVLVDTLADVAVDLAWHHRGELVDPLASDLPPLVEWTAPNETYGFLHDVRRLSGRGTPLEWSAAWQVDGAGSRMWARDPAGTTTVVATSPSNPPAERQSTVLRRTNGRAVEFVAVIEPVQGDPLTTAGVTTVAWEDGTFRDGGLRLIVSHATGRDTWVIEPAAAGSALLAGVETGDDGDVSYRVRLPS
jgi:hypothetical protein